MGTKHVIKNETKNEGADEKNIAAARQEIKWGSRSVNILEFGCNSGDSIIDLTWAFFVSFCEFGA